jgi:Ni/Fe-hydrogenase subunit HybB-like protein
VLTLLYLYFTAVEWLTVSYTASSHEAKISAAVFSGEYAGVFWVALAGLAIPMILLFTQFVKGQYSVSMTVLSGLLVNVAAIAKRYLIVVPSQTHGTLLPYEPGSYSPSWVEYCVVLGLFGLGALMIGVFFKVFPALPLHRKDPGEPSLNDNENEEVLAHA